MVWAMDHDLAFFERDRRPRRTRDDDRYDYGRRREPPPRSYRKRRRAHPHIFAWLLLGGGAVLLAVAFMIIASSLGIWSALSSGYFTVSNAILPEAWQDTWASLPGVAHVAMVLGALFLAAGVLGELFD